MPQAQSPASPASLPAGIEIFAAGRHTDDAGEVREFSPADLQRMATAYNPAVREAPLTVGHPAHNLPAYGYVQRLAVSASGRLAMDPHQVEPQFAEMVRAGRFKKRSASFYPPGHPSNPTPDAWYLRHVAFLGAQPPAVAGLKDIVFSEGDATGAVSFSEPVATKEPDDMSKELQDQLDAEKAAKAKAEADAAAAIKRAEEAEARAASFAEQQRATRRAGFVSFAEGQVKAGRVLPKDKDMVVATLEVLADATPAEFAEGDATRKVSHAQWLQDLITAGKPVVSFGEFAAGSGAHQQVQKGASDADIDAAAQKYAKQHKVSYAEALTHVVSFSG